MQHVIEQIAAVHFAVVLNELLSKVLDDADQIAAWNQRGMRHQQNRGPAKFL